MGSIALPIMAEANIRDTLAIAMGHAAGRPALIIFDGQSGLSRLLTRAYRSVLPDAYALDFDQTSPEAILEAFETLTSGDLVVLLQSSSFRLSLFRIRIELFKRGLKVIEHPHLGRMREPEYDTYFESLAYDPSYYRTVGPWLRERIARARRIRIIGEGTELIYDSPFEEPRLNIGDYSGMKNVGGQYPIGEIFTEPVEIRRVSGSVRLFAFGGSDFSVCCPDREFTVIIEGGILTESPGAPGAFQSVLEQIRAHEEKVWVRELGFGLNRAFSKQRRVSDIGAYERMCGIHLSLGVKHLQYKKSDFPAKAGFHVDVFVDVDRVEIDGEPVFREGRYLFQPV